jgi:TrpR-related protein YerC/YecD
MSRVSPKYLKSSERKEILNQLWLMIASLETREEVENFFRDLLSETEAVMLGRRIQIAKLLLKGLSYENIAERLRASDGTIASVHRWVQSGFGGYKAALPRLEKELLKKEKLEEKHLKQRQPYSFEWLKKRYPLHFLLFNLFEERESKSRKKRS